MPYYLFKVKQDRSTALLLETHSQFRDASASAKIQRQQLVTADNALIKVILASDPLEGERLVLERRHPSSPVEEWEV